MGASADCPHDNPVITTHGPYYRQVHPNHFQDGIALTGSFILGNTSCHFDLSLNDGAARPQIAATENILRMPRGHRQRSSK